MKITDLILQPKHIINEGRVDPNVLMSVDNIIRDGGITNGYQITIMSKIIETIKLGDFYTLSNWNEVTSPSDILTYVKNLPAETIVQMAIQFKVMLQTKDTLSISRYCNPQMALTDWTNFVLRKQD